MVDPIEWIGEFLSRHAARHPAYPWPDDDSPKFPAMVESWVILLRKHRVTERMADHASVALLLVPHYPNNHIAEFFRCLPDPEVKYVKVDPLLEAHWAKGDEILRQRREAAAEAEKARREKAETNRVALTNYLKIRLEGGEGGK